MHYELLAALFRFAPIFSARRHSAANVPLGLVALEYLLYTQIQRAVAVRKALAQILVHGGFADAELLCSRANGRIVLNHVHSQIAGSLFDRFSHGGHLPSCALPYHCIRRG